MFRYSGDIMKLSIVTAYYKTYDLTIKLIERLLPQLNEEVEWLLVDDGCNETRFDIYKDKINIIHLKQNNGAAFTYNYGIDHSKGKYIAFIDCDDLVSEDYVETLLKTINEHNEDLIFMNWIDINTGIIYEKPSNYAAWKAIYKKSIIPRFPLDIETLDVPFHEIVMKNKYSKYYLDKVLYQYNSNRPGSITTLRIERLYKKGGR